MKIKTFIPFCFLFGTLALPQPSLAEEKIEVTPLIQTSEGLSGKNFNYFFEYKFLRRTAVVRNSSIIKILAWL